MTPERRTGFMLLHVMVLVLLVGIISAMSTYTVTHSITLQRRAALWSNDDAVAQEILEQVRRDVLYARKAEVVEEKGPVLRLELDEGRVCYRMTGEKVERVVERANKASVRTSWPLRRSVVRWRMEQIPGGEGVVWTTVQIRDKIDQRHQLKQGYTAIVRVGGLAGVEDVR